MLTAILILLALIAVEIGLGIVFLMVLVSLRDGRSGDRPSGGAVTPPSVPPTSEKEERRAEDAEKRLQEAINNILSYDLTAARKAVRHDADETE